MERIDYNRRMLNFLAIMRNLARSRPIFHNEADFQHALAWELHSMFPDAQLRLEFRVHLEDPAYIDIWFASGGESTAIELKYVVRDLSVVNGGERFELKNHAAHPVRRYDFVKDVERLECIAASMPGTVAASIMLTNDSSYWTPPRSKEQIDVAFRIHEGRVFTGTLVWAVSAAPGTTAGRPGPLLLRSEHLLHWNEYSDVGGPFGTFKYLLVDLPLVRP